MELTDQINAIVKLTEAEKTAIKRCFKPRSIPKGDFFIREHQYCNHVGFVTKGRLRIYYSDENQQEITCHFTNPNEFVTSFTSYLTRTPTKENIEAIEDVEMMVIGREEMERISNEIPKLQIWRRVIAENLYILMEKRISMLQSKSAQERYESMLHENPELILNVPLQYTASFLGITPQHLSRLRKKNGKTIS